MSHTGHITVGGIMKYTLSEPEIVEPKLEAEVINIQENRESGWLLRAAEYAASAYKETRFEIRKQVQEEIAEASQNWNLARRKLLLIGAKGNEDEAAAAILLTSCAKHEGLHEDQLLRALEMLPDVDRALEFLKPEKITQTTLDMNAGNAAITALAKKEIVDNSPEPEKGERQKDLQDQAKQDEEDGERSMFNKKDRAEAASQYDQYEDDFEEI